MGVAVRAYLRFGLLVSNIFDPDESTLEASECSPFPVFHSFSVARRSAESARERFEISRKLEVSTRTQIIPKAWELDLALLVALSGSRGSAPTDLQISRIGARD